MAPGLLSIRAASAEGRRLPYPSGPVRVYDFIPWPKIMTVVRTPIYVSSNGDRWFLCRGEDVEDVFVLHEPNGSSGGTPSRSDLATFLASGHGAPERRALLGMIGALVDIGRASPPPSVQGPEPGAAGAEPTPGEGLSTEP